MSGTNDKETLRQFLEEQFSVVVEGTGHGAGAVSLVGLVHHAHSGDVPVHALSSRQGSPNWGKADPMSEMIDALATRHARGIGGGSSVQQFSLNICRGDSGKPCSTLPFTRASAPTVVGGAGGYGLASEPPNATGATGQGMRLLEILAQGSFAQVAHVTTTQATLIDKLASRLDVVEKRGDERWLALQNLLTTFMQQSIGLQLRALGIEAGRKMLPLLPGMLSTLTGSDKLIPASEVENSLFDTLLENQTPEQLQSMLGALSAQPGGGALSAVLADHLLRARKRREARAREHEELIAGWPSGTSYDEAECDAAGVAFRALAGVEPKTNGTNGHSNGTAQPAPAPAREAGMMPPEAMLDAMLATLAPSEVQQVASMFALKCPDVPGLADEITGRYTRLTGRKAG